MVANVSVAGRNDAKKNAMQKNRVDIDISPPKAGFYSIGEKLSFVQFSNIAYIFQVILLRYCSKFCCLAAFVVFVKVYSYIALAASNLLTYCHKSFRLQGLAFGRSRVSKVCGVGSNGALSPSFYRDTLTEIFPHIA
ncbi:hypothetical protein ACRQ1B_00090 [Rhizobium panacihumi]|uniref:hypothetical protein n=1 Tax=Rhizobium panacihumi TaxID=2008450 RepID=UPI003D79AB1F